MASFAKIGLNNKVIEVVSLHNNVLKDANGIEQENLGVSFLTTLTGWAVWKQTSYNTHLGVHRLGGTPFRKNYAGIGDTYDEDRNAFIKRKPYASWVLNEETCKWESPVPYPDDGVFPFPDKRYNWNEETKQWDIDNS
jgi:hypothetical protein